MEEMDKILKIVADMQEFEPVPDEVTRIVRSYGEEKELTVDELDMVAAASACPMKNFREFLKIIEKK